MKRISLLLLTFLILTLNSCVGAATEIYVQSGDSVQAAVNSAHSGDVIIVQPGEYIGNIDISRGYPQELSNLVLKSASDNPEDTVIIADNSAATTVEGVITVKYKTNVTVRGFKIIGARTNMSGVLLDQSSKCIVENNKFLDNGLGVKVERSTDSVVQNNNIDRISEVGTGTGISIENSGNTKASQNSVLNHSVGISVTSSGSEGSLISGNNLNQNANSGVLLQNTRGVTLDGNTLNLNRVSGIYLSSSNESTLRNNNVTMIDFTVDGTNTNGINLYGSSSNTVSNNYVTDSGHGIFLNTCNENTVEKNTVTANLYGIAMRYSNNNNVINNSADGNRVGFFFTYEDNGNTISGNHANECTDIGIQLTSFCGPNNLVSNNMVNSNGYYGIYTESHDNSISNNSANNNLRGIFLQGSSCYNNKISNNVVNYSTGNGIRLINTSRNNKLDGNTIISNSGDGIYLFNANNSILDNNIVNRNNIGIHLENTSLVTVNNTAAQYNRIGIRLYLSDNNTVSWNNIDSSSESGIDMNSAVNNKAAGNIITLNRKGVTMCPRCSGNTVYNNKFINDQNADVKNAANTWYIAKTQMRNIMSGPFTGGNFWGSLSGRDGFSETATDANGDGIADSVYASADGYITDRYPLVAMIVPIANFNANPTSGYVPLSVQFTDLSQNADSRSWDFGDGILSTEQNPTHTYSAPGIYTVKLTVTNQNGTNSKSATISVVQNAALSVYKSVIGNDETGNIVIDNPGDIVNYRIVVTNEGNVDLHNVHVNDSLIDNLSGPLGDNIEPGVLNQGETWVYNGDYEITREDIDSNGNGDGFVENTVTVYCNELPEESSMVETPITKKADLSIYKSVIGIDEAGDYVINKPGDVINFQVVVKNNGNVKLTGVSISDPMVTLTGPTGDHIEPGVLNPGEIWVYTGDYEVTEADITGNGNGSGFIKNTATVSCNEINERSSTIVVPIIHTPPVVPPESNDSKVLPVANFSTNITRGYAPLSVQFTDLSQNAVSKSWDFNNDGIADSYGTNEVCIFSVPRTYTVNLTVSNGYSTDSKLATIEVLSKPILPVSLSYTNPPTDPDHDGRYEDVNGNGIQDFDDVVAYYDNMDWIGENAPIALFDYNNNTLVDFDDIVKLYDML